jgi:hypothetical protein
MAPSSQWWDKGERETRDDFETGADPDLGSAAREVEREEEEFLDAQPSLESQVSAELRDFAQGDFVPWASRQADVLSAAVGAASPNRASLTTRSVRDAERETIEEYDERFRDTIAALARELFGAGCINHEDSVRMLRASTAEEITDLGPIVQQAVTAFDERSQQS